MQAVVAAIAMMLAAAAPAGAATLRAGDASGLAAAAARARPGDTIILADGVWRDARLTIDARGTAARPITIAAETSGRVILSGASSLRIGGRHLVVAGLVFRDGHAPDGTVVALGRDTVDVRVTEVVIDRYNRPDRRIADVWVALQGQGNRIDHSWFAGKGTAGATLAVTPATDGAGAGGHRIDHNYFGPRPPLGAAGGETIRIVGGDAPTEPSRTMIERNLFDACDGGTEIVAADAGGTIIRDNLIRESRGSIVLRGERNSVERNIIRANGKAHTGGIRIAGRGQIVRGNYIERVAGAGSAGALAIMPGGSAVIEDNAIIDSARIALGPGSAGRFAGNLIRSTLDPFRIDGDAHGMVFAGNISSFDPPAAVVGGVVRSTKDFAATDAGLLHLPGSDAGPARDLSPVARNDTGPGWYPKPTRAATFAGGRQIAVRPGALAAAVRAAGPGDTLRLDAGSYAVTEPLAIDRPLTIVGPAAARIAFAAPTLFQLAEGGSLRVVGVSISGGAAPPTAGNAVIRAPIHPSIANYAVLLDDVAISGLAGAGFDVVATTPGTFATRIDVRASRFAGVSGAIVAASARSAYPADLIRIAKSRMAGVGRIVDMAVSETRDGATAPTVEITDNEVAGGGPVAVLLSGVPAAAVTGNSFADAGGIDIAYPGSGPPPAVRCNRMTGTPAPRIVALASQVESLRVLDPDETVAPPCAERR